MNRTIKDATVKRFHYDSHDRLRTHLADVLAACNFARRLKTPNGLTPYEYICRIWTSEPGRFIPDPIHRMPGLNSYPVEARPPDDLQQKDEPKWTWSSRRLRSRRGRSTASSPLRDSKAKIRGVDQLAKIAASMAKFDSSCTAWWS